MPRHVLSTILELLALNLFLAGVAAWCVWGEYMLGK